MAALTVVAIVFAVALVLWNLRSRELEHARIETVSLTEMLLAQTKQTFNSADLVLLGIQERLQTSYGKQFALDSLPIHLLLGARIAGMPQARSLFLVDSQGKVTNSSRDYPLKGVSAADRDYYQVFLRGEYKNLYIGKPVIGRADDSWTIHLARQLSTSDGKFLGVVVISLNLSYFENIYDIAKLDFVRPIALYLDDGTLMASLPRRDDAIGKHFPELLQAFQAMQGNGIQLHSRRNEDNKKETFSLARIDGLPLLISVTDIEKEALASWRETATPIAIGSLLVCIFIFVAALLLIAELKREEALALALRESDARYLQQIETTNQQLRELSAALQEVREEERTHLSRELHDDLGQQLTGLKLDLTWMGGRVRDGRQLEPERVDEMRLLLDNAIASVRRISCDLRPPVLDDLGFGEAIEWLKRETEKRSELNIRLDLQAAFLVTDPAISTALFRIVQEALTNIIRHADATWVNIRLNTQADKLVLVIDDDGKGFVEESGKAGIGLISMRERIAALGGAFSIIGSVGKGVAIEASVPLNPPDNGENAI